MWTHIPVLYLLSMLPRFEQMGPFKKKMKCSIICSKRHQKILSIGDADPEPKLPWLHSVISREKFYDPLTLKSSHCQKKSLAIHPNKLLKNISLVNMQSQ